MVFEYINIDEVDERYNPYDNYINNRVKKCKYNSYISSNGYCCNKCFKEQKQNKFINKQNYINNLFNQNNQNNQNNKRYNIFEEETKEYDFNNDWNILKLQPPKNKNEIKKQYHKLSLKCHPDKGGSNEEFIKLNNSYNNLIMLLK